MRRGTTPTHTFIVDVSLNDISDLYVTYKQGKNIVVEKTLEDVDIDQEEHSILVYLTQEDTLKFRTNEWTWLYPNENKQDMQILVQIRIKYGDGKAIASDIISMNVQEILKEGEI